VSQTAIAPFRRRKGAYVGLKDIVRPEQLGNMAGNYDLSDIGSLIYDGSNRIALMSDKSGNSGQGSGSSTALYLTGITGAYASSPDSAALDITGDIDLRAEIAPNTWSPGTVRTLVAKYNSTTNQRSYRFIFHTVSGQLRLQTSPDGTTVITHTSSVGTGFSAFSRAWVRVTLDVDNGAGGNTATFYTSSDGVTWTQLGTTSTIASTTSIFSGSAVAEVGSTTSGTLDVLIGSIYRAQIYDGINGTLVFDANFVGQRTNAATFVESSSNAATVTINGSALLGWVTGDTGLVLNGVGGNYASTPDATPLDITGDMSIVIKVALVDYTPATLQALVTKGVGAAKAYSFYLNTNGTLLFSRTTDGSTDIGYISTVPISAVDLSAIWIKVDFDIDNGSGQSAATFYTSSDGVTWTQLGAVVTNASTVATFNGNVVLSIGAFGAGSAFFASGIFYRVQVYNGIAGTLAFDANFTAQPKLVTSFAESSVNTAIVTINASGDLGARICGARDQYMFGNTRKFVLTQNSGGNYATADGLNDYMKCSPFALSQPTTVYFVGSQVTWTNFDRLFDGDASNSADLEQNNLSPVVALRSNVGALPATAGWTVATKAIIASIFNGASSALRVNQGVIATGNPGTGSPNGFTIGSVGAGTSNFSNIQISEILIYSGAHGVNEQNRVIQYLARKWNIPI
jgi:hypothetical protein